MKHYEERTIPARKETFLTKTTCDFCGKEIRGSSGYDVDDVTIERQKGEHYPGGSNGTYYRVDMCNKCWEEKLVPWIQEQKIDIREDEYDF